MSSWLLWLRSRLHVGVASALLACTLLADGPQRVVGHAAALAVLAAMVRPAGSRFGAELRDRGRSEVSRLSELVADAVGIFLLAWLVVRHAVGRGCFALSSGSGDPGSACPRRSAGVAAVVTNCGSERARALSPWILVDLRHGDDVGRVGRRGAPRARPRTGSRLARDRVRVEPRRRRAPTHGAVAARTGRRSSRLAVRSRYMTYSPTYPCVGLRKAPGTLPTV